LAGHAYFAKFRSDPVVNDTVRVVKAISLLERSIRLDPRFVDAHIDLGLALTPSWRCEGDIKLARAHLEKALSLSPDDGMAYYVLAGVLEVEERYPEALSALRKALSLGLRDEVAYLDLPARYQRMCWRMYEGDDQETVQHAGLFAKGLAEASRIFYRLATPLPQFFQTGAYRKADEMGLRNPRFYAELSHLYASLGRREKGFDFVMKAFELDSLSVGSYSYWYWWQYTDSIWNERFLKRMPPGSYYGYLLAAQKYRNARRTDSAAAERLLRTAIQLQPTYGAAYVLLGQSRFHEPQKAVKDFEKAVSLEFHEVTSMFTAAEQLSAQGDFDLAFQYYKRILSLDLAPRIVVLKSMGMAYEQKKDRRAAFSTYIEMDRVCPKAILCGWWGHEAATLMSIAYADKGDYDKAIEILKRSMGNQRWQKMVRPYWRTGDPKTYADIGQLYSKKGDSKNAIAFYMEALENEAEHPEAHFGLAEEYAKTNLRDKAIESYRHAARLGVPAAKKALQKLGETEEAQGKR
jgi:tetratricopeptide (TPR) repeat protein